MRNYSSKQYFYLIVLVVTVIFTTWLLTWQFNRTTTSTTQNAPSHHLNAFANDVVALRFDPTGKLINELHVNHLKHYVDDSSDFVKPTLFVYSEENAPWEIKADFGHAENGIKIIQLWDNVVLHQPSRGTHREITITTTRATIYPEKDYAETDQLVNLVQPGVIIKSVGVRAYFKRGQIELLSKAQGQYESTTKKP